MNALKTIAWFVAMWLSVMMVFQFVGSAGLVRMFPEGDRWWLFPVQLLTLMIFAGIVLCNPF